MKVTLTEMTVLGFSGSQKGGANMGAGHSVLNRISLNDRRSKPVQVKSSERQLTSGSAINHTLHR
jgi:hypothetical protein